MLSVSALLRRRDRIRHEEAEKAARGYGLAVAAKPEWALQQRLLSSEKPQAVRRRRSAGRVRRHHSGSGGRFDLCQVCGQLCIALAAVEAVMNLTMASRADRSYESGVI